MLPQSSESVAYVPFPVQIVRLLLAHVHPVVSRSCLPFLDDLFSLLQKPPVKWNDNDGVRGAQTWLTRLEEQRFSGGRRKETCTVSNRPVLPEIHVTVSRALCLFLLFLLRCDPSLQQNTISYEYEGERRRKGGVNARDLRHPTKRQEMIAPYLFKIINTTTKDFQAINWIFSPFF